MKTVTLVKSEIKPISYGGVIWYVVSNKQIEVVGSWQFDTHKKAQVFAAKLDRSLAKEAKLAAKEREERRKGGINSVLAYNSLRG